MDIRASWSRPACTGFKNECFTSNSTYLKLGWNFNWCYSNCWNHTEILHNLIPLLDDAYEDHDIEDELGKSIEALNFRDRMQIKEFFTIPDEDSLFDSWKSNYFGDCGII